MAGLPQRRRQAPGLVGHDDRSRQGARHRQVLRHLRQRASAAAAAAPGRPAQNPATGKPYGTDFPDDHHRRHGERRRCCCSTTSASASCSPPSAARWAACRCCELADLAPGPRRTSASPLATAARQPTMAIAFNEVGRQAIMADPNWRGGALLRRQVAAPSGLSRGAHDRPHHLPVATRRCRRSSAAACRTCTTTRSRFSADFEVESYLRHQGLAFTERFDANTLPVHHARAGLLRPHPSAQRAWSRRCGRRQGAVPRHGLQQRLAASAVPAQGDRQRAARDPQARELLRGARSTTATTPSCSSARRWRASSSPSWRAARRTFTPAG